MKFSRRAYESGEIDWPLIFVAILFCIYATWEIYWMQDERPKGRFVFYETGRKM